MFREFKEDIYKERIIIDAAQGWMERKDDQELLLNRKRLSQKKTHSPKNAARAVQAEEMITRPPT